MKIGIDKLGFFVPKYYVDMTELAEARAVDPAKFHIGIGQDKMAVTTPTQDIVTLAANAASQILNKADRQLIDMIIVATESSVDESKAAAVILQKLLKIQSFVRSFEIKEACYGATAGLMMAYNHISLHPESKVLVIASDVASYGLATAGEPTQGAGAVAMLISRDPRIFSLNNDNVALTEDVYDFWRPTGEKYPRVNGKLSNENYIQNFARLWEEYQKRTGKDFSDFEALIFHVPYTKMGRKALSPLTNDEKLFRNYEKAVIYNRQVGNLYTGSLYLSLLSLLENADLKGGSQIGLFSYGSGSVAEIFSGELVEGYEKLLQSDFHRELLAKRQRLSISDYEEIFESKELRAAGLPFELIKIEDGIRYYKEI